MRKVITKSTVPPPSSEPPFLYNTRIPFPEFPRVATVCLARIALQSVALALSLSLHESFCLSSPGRLAILQLVCSHNQRKLQEELSQIFSNKPRD